MAFDVWGGYKNWAAKPGILESLTITPEEFQNLLGYGQRFIGTQTAQSQNRLEDLLGYNRAPLGTQTAAHAGAAYTGQLAGEKFAFDVTNLKQQMDAQATQFIIDAVLREQGAKEAQQAQWMQLLQPALFGLGAAVGGPVGGYIGGKVGGWLGQKPIK
jgi:hypothetical protein